MKYTLHNDTITLYRGDCLEVMQELPDQSVDAVICDLPYGTTNCPWDSIIPFSPMWQLLQRIIKPRRAIVLFAAQPFTSALIMSNPEWFKYQWVWEKTRPFGLFNAKNKPLNKHEDICIFSDGTTANKSNNKMLYNPQGLIKVDREWKRPRKYETEHRASRPSHSLERIIEFTNYPNSILKVSNSNHGNLHPTQKPEPLLEYLILTYTNEGDTVLDFTFGSCTAGVAAVNTKRRFIGIERDEKYFDIGLKRVQQTIDNLPPMDL